MQKTYFDNYIQTLKKLDQKRFQNVLDLYEELKPRHYTNIKKQIETNKRLSDIAKTQMLQFNNYIFDKMFASNEFIK